MSRYEFTDSNGYRVGPVIEARTATEARAKVEGITGQIPRYCTHLSDADGRASHFYGNVAPDLETLAEESGARG